VQQRGTPEQIAAAERLLAGAFAEEAEARAGMAALRPLYEHNPPASAPPDRSILDLAILNWFFAKGVHAYDLRERLGEISTPTLVMTGRHDWICPPDQSAALMAGLPNARQVIFENSAHRPMREENAAFVAAVSEFIEAIS
jgi:proline iminopeptidase